MLSVLSSSCVKTDWKCVLSNCDLSSGSVTSVVVVFQGCDRRCVLSARLKEFEEVFRVISDVVCEVGGNMFVFCFLYVLGKCFLVSCESSQIFWCIVCLRASVESLFFAMLST